jgi:regulation of enolase protein 1 (concanavalin A-like superfamily)
MKFMGIEFTKALNEAMALAAFHDGSLVLKSNAGSDYFNNPDGITFNNTAPVLLSRVDNTKPFTFASRVTPAFFETYDAGAVYVYANDKLWMKFALERDERGRKRVVTVRTIDTSDDNNHDIVDRVSVYLKVSSDTRTIGYYYSLDREEWQLVRLYRNDYPSDIWVGVSVQSPIGNGTTATFDECLLTESSVSDFRKGI